MLAQPVGDGAVGVSPANDARDRRADGDRRRRGDRRGTSPQRHSHLDVDNDNSDERSACRTEVRSAVRR